MIPGYRQHQSPPIVLIEPASRRSFARDILEIWSFREVISTLAMREISIRYKQTVIGILWTFIQPIVTTVIFTVIFGVLAKIPSEGTPYPVFVFSGLLLWQYISRIISEGTSSLVANTALITKVYFSRLAIPLISIFVAGVDFIISFLVLCALMIIYDVGFSIGILAVPVILMAAAFLGYSIALILSPVNAIYRDVAVALPFLLQMLMYLSPIIYPVSFVPENLQWLFYLNPIATLLSAMRWAMIGGAPPSSIALVAFAVTVTALFLFGLHVFRRLEPTLVDRI